MATPLIKISEKIYAKLETYQPTGSVKDRMVNYIVKDAVTQGQIIPGKTELVEATSGNTGIALAAAAAQLGCSCTIIMPKNMSEQRKTMMRAFGAYIIQVGDNEFQKAIELRDYRIANIKRTGGENAIWSPKQFENKLNIRCHYEETAPEIFNQTVELGLVWADFLHGAGTGGTMMGVKKYIDHHNLNIKCILTQPAEPAEEHGIQGINDGANFLLDVDLIDNIVKIKTEEAVDRMKRFAKENGLLIGISSGANILAAERYVERNSAEGVVVTMICDRGERYI